MGKRGPDFSEQDDAFLRQHYLKRGARWCAERLPGRTEHGVRGRARRLKITRCAADLQRPTNDMIDAAIRRAYTGERKVGFVTRCAESVGRTRTWVATRALTLGLIKSRDMRPWTEEEFAFASQFPLARPVDLAKKMRRRGWQRTPSAIAKMRFEDRVERADDRRFTAAGLADVMGVGTNVVTGWIRNGLLHAERRGWDRTEAQHGDGYLIHERDIAHFIVQHPAHISLTKLEPNKFWLIDLLVRLGGPASATGRQKRERVVHLAETQPDLSPAEIAERTGSTLRSVSSTLSQARASAREAA